jgi:hypothetical protein
VKSSLTVKRAEVDAYIENPAVPKENVRWCKKTISGVFVSAEHPFTKNQFRFGLGIGASLQVGEQAL